MDEEKRVINKGQKRRIEEIRRELKFEQQRDMSTNFERREIISCSLNRAAMIRN